MASSSNTFGIADGFGLGCVIPDLCQGPMLSMAFSSVNVRLLLKSRHLK
jgi:hypothetical protein